jgi:hypothetical protein
MMRTLILSLTCLSTALAAPTPCPTCPKGYAVSSLEEALLPKAQDKVSSEISSSKPVDVEESTPIKEAVQMASNTYRPNEKSPSQSASGLWGDPSPLAPKRRDILSDAKAVGIPVGNLFDAPRPSMQNQAPSGGFGRR